MTEDEQELLARLVVIGLAAGAGIPIEALRTLAKLVLDNPSLNAGDVVESLESLIRDLDRLLGQQINAIQFQQLESAWRGLSHLVRNIETDRSLKIKVLHVSQGELRASFAQYSGTAWTKNPQY